jgi:membrane protease YdiL (CAAX protease family)
MLTKLRPLDALVAWLLNGGMPFVFGIGVAIFSPAMGSRWEGQGLLRVAVVVLLVGWLALVRGVKLDDFARLLSSSGKPVTLGVVVGLAFFIVEYLAVVVIHFIDRTPNLVDGTWNPWVATRSLAEFSIAFVLVFGLIGPFVEELVHRGVAYPGLRNRFGIVVGAAVSTVIFALGHEWTVHDLASAFVLGLIAVWLVERYQSLLPAIAIHMTVNLSVVAVGWSLYNVFGIPGSSI